MFDRPKLWRRVCSSCGMLDQWFAAIATEIRGEEALADPWACPHCGSTEAVAARPLEGADLELFDDSRPRLRLV